MPASISSQEALGGRRVLGDDRLGVLRAVVALICAIALADAVDHARRDDGVEIFGVPVGFGRRLHARVGGLERRVAADFAAGLDQIVDDRRDQRRGARSTSRVSVAPQTPVRRILAFTTMARAFSKSASPSI